MPLQTVACQRGEPCTKKLDVDASADQCPRTRLWNPSDSWREHVVPYAALLHEAIRLLKTGATTATIASLLENNTKIVLVTKAVAEKVDTYLKSSMPTGWQFGSDVFSRLHLCDIKFWKIGDVVELPNLSQVELHIFDYEHERARWQTSMGDFQAIELKKSATLKSRSRSPRRASPGSCGDGAFFGKAQRAIIC